MTNRAWSHCRTRAKPPCESRGSAARRLLGTRSLSGVAVPVETKSRRGLSMRID